MILPKNRYIQKKSKDRMRLEYVEIKHDVAFVLCSSLSLFLRILFLCNLYAHHGAQTSPRSKGAADGPARHPCPKQF